MKKRYLIVLLFIATISLAACTNNSTSDKVEINNPPTSEVVSEKGSVSGEYDIIYTPRDNTDIKTIKEKDENVPYTIYSYAGDVDVKINGKIMSLKDAMDKGKLSIKEVLAKAKKDEEKGINKGDMYRDGGSLIYEYPGYTIIKCNTLDGIEDVYIGNPGMSINDFL